ncbi:MAG: hypothetical protein GY898_23075 [Proteobacteria bacterium]|nr:hypothetical protein [Pseudomonadota bacterium]
MKTQRAWDRLRAAVVDGDREDLEAAAAELNIPAATVEEIWTDQRALEELEELVDPYDMDTQP